MNTLVYFVYGSCPRYRLELTYSAFSALHWAKTEAKSFRIALVTDKANQRQDLPIENVFFSDAEFARWTCGGNYKHQAKLHALLKALDLFGGKVALVDTDTYFKANPARLFEQIGPGRSLMHAYEGVLGSDRYLGPILAKIGGRPLKYQISAATRLFNSGVIGLDFGDRVLAQNAIQLVEKLYAIYPAFNTEQFALSIVLDKLTILRDCPDIVEHYYGFERGFIDVQIASLFPTIFSQEEFHGRLGHLPKVGGFPKKRAIDRLSARIRAVLRREGAEYRFAYLAFLCALSSIKRFPINANIWARVAVDMLRQYEFVIAHVERDFSAMRRNRCSAWQSAETKVAWSNFWREVDQARTRGRARTTAPAYSVTQEQEVSDLDASEN